jgi:hypothetical protein
MHSTRSDPAAAAAADADDVEDDLHNQKQRHKMLLLRTLTSRATRQQTGFLHGAR